MKTYLLCLLACFSMQFASAQKNDIQTDTILVQGNCNQCKSRIEDAAYVKGVKHAVWNKETQELIVTYRPSKTNNETIQKNVAANGHRTEKYDAVEKAYQKLPECCQYKTNNTKH
jgi:mercuric ion binding protein